MNYSQRQDYQRETGAFYTPKFACDIAIRYIEDSLGKEAFKQLYFYDPAAGEGNLLDALPSGTKRIGSTLEIEDVEVLLEKGYEAFQFDFLNGDLASVIPLLPRNLVVFMNPPYFKSQANGSRGGLMYGTGDSVQIFYYRVFKELNPLFVFSFNKLDLFQSSSTIRIRNDLELRRRLLKSPFITNSKDWGLHGEFPIGFFGYQNII